MKVAIVEISFPQTWNLKFYPPTNREIYNGAFHCDVPHLTLDFLFAADFHNLYGPNFGAGVSMKYVIL